MKVNTCARPPPPALLIGLLGKANVGKSTFFSAATQTPAATGNFPFTTIKPNVGVAHARTKCACADLGISHEHPLCSGGTRLVPVKLMDVAGLVPGAHEGRGLGNQFLDDARQADALIHVVDASGSTDEQGQPVPAGTHDPAGDVRFVEDEFDAWFSGILVRDWDKISRDAERSRSGPAPGISQRLSGLGVRDAQVASALQRTGLGARPPKEWSEDDIRAFSLDLRRDAKPMVVAANKADLRAPEGLGDAIPCSAEAELVLRKAASAGLVRYEPGAPSFEETGGATPQQKKALDAMRAVLGRLPSTGVQDAIDAAVFKLLGMIVAYPVEDESKFSNRDGEVLPDARLMRPGSTARDLAGTVHADLERGFLHAVNCRTGQRMGGDQELEDGAVVRIVSAQGR